MSASEVSRVAAEAAIRELLAARATGKTICPSEAARALAGDHGFRPLMVPVRDAARALAACGEIEVTQRGEPVDIDSVRGPIRLGLPSNDRNEPTADLPGAPGGPPTQKSNQKSNAARSPLRTRGGPQAPHR